MEQTIAPPPPSATTAVTTTVTNPDSVTSSPRYRHTDSWTEDTSLYPTINSSTAAAAAATAAGGGGLTKLRLMCSYGGHIVPRPHDKSLCYVGGDTRIVVVDRHTTLSDLTNRLTKTVFRSSSSSGTASFTVKYQLPLEDLDSLISVTTDEDLENMIDEYERLNLNNSNSSTDSNKSNRLRLFLFPVKPESVTSIGSLLESTTKSEDWFLNALNGTSSGFSDTSSVNCLLGLEDDVSVPEKKHVIGKNLRANHSVQDVQSVPDSPMMETTSSFGSASSSPSLANLPPVRVNVEDQKVGGGVEEQFAQMSVQQHVKHPEDVNFVAAPAPVVVAGVPVVSKVAVMENPNRLGSEDERSEQGFQIAHLKQQQQQQQQQQQYQQNPSMGFDMTSPDFVSSDGSVTNPLSRRKPPVTYQDPIAQTQFSTNNTVRTTDPSNMHDQNTRVQIQQPQQVQDSAYLISSPTTQVDPQNPQLHPQPQFIHTAVPQPQYLHHPPGAVPMASYYQMYPSQSQIRAPHPALDQHNFVYYMPARQPPQGYNLPLQADPAASAPPSNQVPPPSGLFTAPRAVQTAAKTETPAGVYRTATSSGALPPQLVQVPSSQHQIQPQYVGYSHMHQPSQPVASGGGDSGNYVYEFTDPSHQGQHIYYAAQPQPLPPQSAAQYQTMTSTLPVEAQAGSHLQADNSMKQQVRTSQP